MRRHRVLGSHEVQTPQHHREAETVECPVARAERSWWRPTWLAHVIKLMEEDAAGDATEEDEAGLHERNDEEGIVHAKADGETIEPEDAKARDEQQRDPEETVSEYADVAVREEQLTQLCQGLRMHDHLRSSEQSGRDREGDWLQLILIPHGPPLLSRLLVARMRDKADDGQGKRQDDINPPCPPSLPPPVAHEHVHAEAVAFACAE
mmetsp:Transcript_8417/g.22023  ORF Transcript_8417/g.22023 Transcript_8417/m.22023 type:complete len:207 (+) Transcript_8417:784-1404(+)